MMTFDILVPIIALAFAGVAVLVVHLSDKKLDRQAERHPAE